MTKSPSRKGHARNGVALIELAIALPVMVVVVMGSIDMTLYVQKSSAVRAAADRAARFACQLRFDERNSTAWRLQVQKKAVAELSEPNGVRARAEVFDVDKTGLPLPVVVVTVVSKYDSLFLDNMAFGFRLDRIEQKVAMPMLRGHAR